MLGTECYMCGRDAMDTPSYAKIPKLVPDLRNKRKYIVHHKILVIVCRWACVWERSTESKIQGKNPDGAVHSTQH